MENVDVAVVGAGLIGAAVAYDLQAAGVRAVVLEAAGEPAAGVSRPTPASSTRGSTRHRGRWKRP